MSTTDIKSLVLSPFHLQRVAELNRECLLLTRDLLETTAAGGMVCGIDDPDVANLIVSTQMQSLRDLTDCGMPIWTLRVLDKGFWTRASQGRPDGNFVTHALLASISRPTEK